MLDESDTAYIAGRLKVHHIEPRLLQEACEDYRRRADPGVSERDFVFGYVASSFREREKLLERKRCEKPKPLAYSEDYLSLELLNEERE